MTSGETFFRMVACFRQEGEGLAECDAADAEWMIHASLRRSRGGRKVSAVLTADNLVTGELLTFPQDFDRIVAVLPVEFWPQFVKDLQVPVPFEQPVLV